MHKLNLEREFPISICDILQIVQDCIAGSLPPILKEIIIKQIENKLKSIRNDRIPNYEELLEFSDSYR